MIVGAHINEFKIGEEKVPEMIRERIKKILDDRKKNKNGSAVATATDQDNSLDALSAKHRLKEYQWFS